MKEHITSNDALITNNMSEKQLEVRDEFLALCLNSPIPKEEFIDCLQLYTGRQSLQRLIFLNQIYLEIINTHGVIMEFGVRWGVNLANLLNLRAIYEPYNPTRKIIGFDTFDGFPSISKNDGESTSIKVGSHKVSNEYDVYLDKVLSNIERDAPIQQIKKFEIVKGDASITVPNYIETHKETLISMAYFDFDIYKPTRDVLMCIRDRLVKGSIIVFDELNYHRYPGETIAFLECLGSNNYHLIRSPNSGTVSYLRFS